MDVDAQAKLQKILQSCTLANQWSADKNSEEAYSRVYKKNAAALYQLTLRVYYVASAVLGASHVIFNLIPIAQ